LAETAILSPEHFIARATISPLTILPYSYTLRPLRDLKMGPRLREDDIEFVVVAVPSTDTQGVHNSHHCGLGP
jgi:hypothetical protein